MRKIAVVETQYSRWPRTRVGSLVRKAGCVIQLFCQVEQLNVSLGKYTFELRSGKRNKKDGEKRVMLKISNQDIPFLKQARASDGGD